MESHCITHQQFIELFDNFASSILPVEVVILLFAGVGLASICYHLLDAISRLIDGRGIK